MNPETSTYAYAVQAGFPRVHSCRVSRIRAPRRTVSAGNLELKASLRRRESRASARLRDGNWRRHDAFQRWTLRVWGVGYAAILADCVVDVLSDAGIRAYQSRGRLE